ncbi:hypothetical protein ACIHIX_29375 [Streptomyces sp. NPDC051913]|uniref:hypothetical protein n=1 Tax=Streptomyces sp. NPDC051913 TaxID=3365676 RepID=UPI0037D27708
MRGTRLTPAAADALPGATGTVDLRLSGLTAVDAIGELRDRGIAVGGSGVERGHRRVLEPLGVLPEIPTSKTGAIPSAAGAAAP